MMKSKSQFSVFAAGVLCVSALFSAVNVAAASNACDQVADHPDHYMVGQGSQQNIRYAAKIERIAIGDPEIADVQVTTKTAFLVTGRKTGETSLLVWTECSPDPVRSEVVVESGLVAAAKSPSDKSKVDPAQLPSQVQTDIRFVEVSRTKMQQAGAQIFGTKASGNFLFGAPGTASNGTTTTTVSPGSVPNSPFPGIPLLNTGFNIVWGGGSSQLLGIINALESTGYAYTLAQPSLVALSGQSANFLAGGEFPIPVPQGGTGTGVSNLITIAYKEFGIRLTLTPTVLSANQIELKVAPEVSELDFPDGLQIDGLTVPALKVRRADTSISLASGESFVIGGLISRETVESASKFPGLGDIPILGAFFRNNSLSIEDRELIMIVTPHLVKPLAENAQTPKLPGESIKNYDPNYLEFFFMENGRYDRSRSSNNGFSN